MNKQEEEYYKRKLIEYEEQREFDDQVSGCLPLIVLLIFILVYIFSL